MRMPELKSLARDLELRNDSRMRKAELVALLQNNPPPGQSCTSAAPTPHTRPPPPPQMSTWEPIDDRRPRAPTKQEMDMFEQLEMSKSRPQVKSKLKGQLQRFHKLSLFDTFRHVENGLDINFLKFIFVFVL